jgi:alginate O-acetyltransferase complex protein AlgI
VIFTSFEFVLFFVIVLTGRSLCRSFTVEKWFLLVASYIFYMSWSVPFCSLILMTSLIDFAVGLGLGKIDEPRKRRLLLVVSIVANLGVLAFFKYTNFLLGNVEWVATLFGTHLSRWHYDIILPAGISFFTFQSMSYTISVYRRQIQPCQSARDFLLYVAFFPQLLAGPIVRAADLLPQIYRRVRANIYEIESGLAQFALGAVKKIVISDQIAPNVDLIFNAPGNYDGFTLWQGVLGYAVQIYCDFSGYSDMAIGCARIMGFHFPENFQMPYSAASITEFWQRWHISLSSWFRDYLYIPLGGNRKGTGRTYFNLLLTMLLCGLWHGASWNFVLWGGIHGLSLASHRIWKNWNPLRSFQALPVFRFGWTIFSHLLTLGIILVGWVFFRAQSLPLTVQYLSRMLTWKHEGVHLVSPYILPAVVAVFVTHLLVQKDRNWAQEIPRQIVFLRVGFYAGLVLLLCLLGVTDSVPFIYFQF